MRFKFYINFNYYILLFLILSLVSCKESIHKVSRPLIGTIINLTVVADDDKAAQASEAVFNEIKRIETLMSPFSKKGDVYRINSSASGSTVKISRETYSLIEKSLFISDDTGGAFDISFASISHLWNYRDSGFIPPHKNIVKRFLPLVDYRNIQLSEKNGIKFKKTGMKIGLGGVAKGYAIHRAVSVLKEMGVESGILDAGGDLQVLGTKFGKSWRTGLRHPRKDNLLLVVELYNMDTIASSGDYERFTMYKNKRYHHIIDPHSGYPTETLASVSVISKDPVVSDSYATAIFVMGHEKALKLLKRHKEISVILVGLDLKVYISKDLKERVKLLEDVDVSWI